MAMHVDLRRLEHVEDTSSGCTSAIFISHLLSRGGYATTSADT